MLIFKQTDEQLPSVFHRYGCHVLALASMLNTLTGVCFTPGDLMWEFIEGHQRGYILDDLYVKNPDFLLQSMLKRKGASKLVSVYQIGAMGRFWLWVKQRDYAATILKFETAHGNSHFLEADEKQNVLYNPDPSVELGELQNVLYYQMRRRFA